MLTGQILEGQLDKPHTSKEAHTDNQTAARTQSHTRLPGFSHTVAPLMNPGPSPWRLTLDWERWGALSSTGEHGVQLPFPKADGREKGRFRISLKDWGACKRRPTFISPR